MAQGRFWRNETECGDAMPLIRVSDSRLTPCPAASILGPVVAQSRRFEVPPREETRNPMRIRSPLTAPDLSSCDAFGSRGALIDALRCGAHSQPAGRRFEDYGIEQGLARLVVRLDPSASVRLPLCSQPRRSSHRPATRCPRNPNQTIVTDTHVRHINTRRSLAPSGWPGPQPPRRQEFPRQS